MKGMNEGKIIVHDFLTWVTILADLRKMKIGNFKGQWGGAQS